MAAGWNRNDKKAKAMYRDYQGGKSLSQVSIQYGITRQAVYDTFKLRDYKLRTRTLLPTKEFNGNKYTLRNNGYYGKTKGGRTLLHRDVWEHHNGPIPKGYDIHHLDNDKTNCDIANLELLPKSEHTRKYSPHNNQYTKGRKTSARS